MPTSKAQQRAVNKYVANNYDRVLVTMPRGQKDKVRTHAEAQGESVNGFINRAMLETMERDNAPQRPQEAPVVQEATQAPKPVQEQPTEGIPLHTLEQRIRRTLYKYSGTIKKDRKTGGYTVVFQDRSINLPDFEALLEYAQGLDKA